MYECFTHFMPYLQSDIRDQFWPKFGHCASSIHNIRMMHVMRSNPSQNKKNRFLFTNNIISLAGIWTRDSRVKK